MKANQYLFGLLFAVGGLLFCASCNSDEKTSEKQREVENNDSTTASHDNSSQGSDYYHLTGTVATLPVTMELFEVDYKEVESQYFKGSYYYDKYGDPIAINGSLDEKGNLIINEQGSWQGSEHRFEGSWNPKSGFSGKWINGNNQQEHPFSLQISYDGVLELMSAFYNNSLKAFPNWPVSPMFTYESEWVYPKAGTLPPQQQAFLENALINGVLNNNTDNKKGPLVPALKDFYDELAEDFMQEMYSLQAGDFIDSLKLEKDGYAPEHVYSTGMQVYYNTDTLLTVGYTDYSYSGGAHGLYSTQVATYDIKGQRRLKTTDILHPGYEATVGDVLAQAFRTKYGLGEQETLNTILFDSTILPNDNFGITPKGMFFIYAPYEIAPYAVGEIELFIAFAEIEDFVKSEWWTPIPTVKEDSKN